MKVHVDKMQAMYFCVKVQNKLAPLNLSLQDGSEKLRESNQSLYPGPIGTKRQIKVFYSYENQSPSENENENDGQFVNNET